MDILPLEVKLEEYSDDELLLEGNDQQQRMLYARDNLMRILDQDVEGDNGSTSPKAKNSVKSKTPLPMGQRVPCSYCDKTFKSWAIYRLHEKVTFSKKQNKYITNIYQTHFRYLDSHWRRRLHVRYLQQNLWPKIPLCRPCRNSFLSSSFFLFRVYLLVNMTQL